MKNAMLVMVGLMINASAFAAAIVEKESVLLTGSHASDVRALLRSKSARTQNFIKVVGQLTLEGTNVRMKGENLGLVSDIRDAKLNQLGNAFGQDASGRVFIRGTLAAYLEERRDLRRFDCHNTSNSGSIGFPGTTTSACEIR